MIFATCGLRNVSHTAEVCFNEYVELVPEEKSGLISDVSINLAKIFCFAFKICQKIIMLRHSGCGFFDKMFFSQFGSGDDVIAGASVQRVRD